MVWEICDRQEVPWTFDNGKPVAPKQCNSKQAIGNLLLITGIVVVILAALMASGKFGGGKMYLAASGVLVGAIGLLLSGALLACRNKPAPITKEA